MREEPQDGFIIIILLIFCIFSGFTTFPEEMYGSGKAAKMLKALTLEAGEAISILHRPEVEARSVKRRRRRGSIILATALAVAPFSDRTALAGSAVI